MNGRPASTAAAADPTRLQNGNASRAANEADEMVAGTLPSVCIITESFHPVVGGGETHARHLCEELSRRGCRTMVITRRTTPQFARFEQLGNTRVHRVPPARFNRLGKYGMLLPAFLALCRRRSEYDVIYVVGLRLLGVVGVLAARLLGRRCIVRAGYCGELSGSYLFEGSSPRRGIVGSLLGALLLARNRVVLRADRFLSVSSAITSEYQRCGVPASKIWYIPNGVRCDRFTPVGPDERAELRRRLGLASSARIWAYSGKLNAGKGLELLLRVWARAIALDPRLYLLLIGAGDNQFLSRERELREIVRQTGLEAHVGFTGYVENVNEYLQCCDFFVMPSESESFCNALIEALATELPAVATRVGGMIDIIHDGENGRLIDAGDERQLLDAIIELSSDGTKARRFAQRGRATVMDRFEIGAVSREYFSLFSSLVETSPDHQRADEATVGVSG